MTWDDLLVLNVGNEGIGNGMIVKIVMDHSSIPFPSFSTSKMKAEECGKNTRKSAMIWTLWLEMTFTSWIFGCEKLCKFMGYSPFSHTIVGNFCVCVMFCCRALVKFHDMRFFLGWAEASRKRNVTLQEMEPSNSAQENRVKETWNSALRGSYSTDGFISGVACGDLKDHQSVGCAAGMMCIACIAAPGGTRKPRNAGEVEVSMRLDAWFVGDGGPLHFDPFVFDCLCVFWMGWSMWKAPGYPG